MFRAPWIKSVSTNLHFIVIWMGLVSKPGINNLEFRHPDATPNAYSTMGALGILVLIEALALYSSSWIVYGLFLAFYVGMTIFIAFDAYYLGIGK